MRHNSKLRLIFAFAGACILVCLADEALAQARKTVAQGVSDGRQVTLTLSAENPDILPTRLSVPAPFVDGRFPVGAGHIYGLPMLVKRDQPECKALPSCVSMFEADRGARDIAFALRVAPAGWFKDLLSSRVATGYFIFGLQIYDEGITAGAPGRLQLSNLGQPRPGSANDKGQWSSKRPPATVIKCIDTASAVSLCEVEVEVGQNLIAVSEIPMLELGYWPQLASAVGAFSEELVVKP